MSKVEIYDGKEVENDKGGYLELILKNKQGEKYPKKVFDEECRNAWNGPGTYEVEWIKERGKNGQSYMNIKSMIKDAIQDHKENISNGNGSKTHTIDSGATNRSIMAQVAIKSATDVICAVYAGNSHLTPGDLENYVKGMAAGFFIAMEKFIQG